MAAQSGDLLYAERLGIPGVLTAQEIADLAPERTLGERTDVVLTTPVAGDLLQFDGTNWVNIRPEDIPIIAALISSIALTEVFLGGSLSNAANQSFTINLEASPFSIGDTVELSNFEFRGDFSAANEFVTVAAGVSSIDVGAFASSDDAIWKNDVATNTLTATIVDIGGGVKGITLLFSPTTAVNFTPGGMTNWWEIRSKIKAV